MFVSVSVCGGVYVVKTVKHTSVDKRTLQEQTALLIATDGKHLECVKCLLEAGADPDISNKNKETPLYKGMGCLILFDEILRHHRSHEQY